MSRRLIVLLAFAGVVVMLAVSYGLWRQQASFLPAGRMTVNKGDVLIVPGDHSQEWGSGVQTDWSETGHSYMTSSAMIEDSDEGLRFEALDYHANVILIPGDKVILILDGERYEVTVTE